MREKEGFTVEHGVTTLKLTKARKLEILNEVLAAKVVRELTCSNRTIDGDIKRRCADEIAALNREILVLRLELNQINRILPDKFSEAEHAIVNPPMYGGRKYVINSIKNSKPKYKSLRKNRLSKTQSRKLKSRKLKR